MRTRKTEPVQVAVHARLATNAIVAVLGSALSACAIAQPPDPVFRQNFSELCAEPAAPQLVGWSVSSALPRGLWNSRLTCVSDEGARYAGADGKPAGALRITVQSGDAYETADGQRPTERVRAPDSQPDRQVRPAGLVQLRLPPGRTVAADREPDGHPSSQAERPIGCGSRSRRSLSGGQPVLQDRGWPSRCGGWSRLRRGGTWHARLL